MASTALSAREPLIIRGAVVAAVTGLIHALVVLGVLSLSHEAEIALAGAVDLLGTAVLVIWARGAVSPTNGDEVVKDVTIDKD